MTTNLAPGFVAIHGNQLEQLRDAVFGWLKSNPLAPLEQEIFLVQSNGVADWLKISLAEQLGVCAATKITLPARFLWEAYRSALGAEHVPRRSAFDRQPLTWRLMQLLPMLLDRPAFAPLNYFLKDGTFERRLQLAEKLADLFDQYQVYRANWLFAWANNDDVLIDAAGQKIALTKSQLWQAQLWRAVRESAAAEERNSGRADIHRLFIDCLDKTTSSKKHLPRRVILFGVSALPYQTLEALGALAQHIQVIVAVPNPCQHYWGDIISGRDLLKAERRRQQHCPRRGDLSTIPFEQLHAHCHPLLAAWGRLGRDFIRMLDEFDDAEATRQSFPNLRIDLFSDGPGHTLLSQLQVSIRDMQPIPEKDDRPAYRAGDGSIQFHIAHSVQREVEILHDQLLDMFALTPVDEHGNPDEARRIKPRDVVVMVPDIEKFSPSIRAVFSQYLRDDKRFIPYEIADISERRVNPLLVALEWLLRLPQQRCLQSEVRDLLDVPAIAARFGITPFDLPRVAQWVEASGVRWGLDRQHRDALDLGPAGEQNAWLFGVRRMLLGYANGADASYEGIEPFAQVGGLDAALAGSLADFVECLLYWRRELATARSPAQWGERAEKLQQAFFKVGDDRDRLTMAQLAQSLERWLDHCDSAGFAEAVPVSILREAWLGPIDEKTLNQRFISGGVTFCTLMPMRAVPYRVVCLLGMNDGDFPRRAHSADFDLLALPGMACPGDRSRREDDRYLMLEAVLSARERLYISWAGRSVRDNSTQPPSVLIAQLQDYLKAGWSNLDLAQLTTDHPLQPFSLRYFEQGGLRSYAKEWRVLHDRAKQKTGEIVPAFVPEPESHLRLADLEAFMKQPVKEFFRRRLGVQFRQEKVIGLDDEPFAWDKLEEYKVCEFLLADSGLHEPLEHVHACLEKKVARLKREGRMPIGHLAHKMQADLVEELTAVRSAWLAMVSRFPVSSEKVPVSIPHAFCSVEDWVDRIGKDGAADVWFSLNAGKALKNKTGRLDVKNVRMDKLIAPYLRQLVLSALGRPLTGYTVYRDCILRFGTLTQDIAKGHIDSLLSLWLKGMSYPLPTACKTALALLMDGEGKAMEAYDGPAYASDYSVPGEVNEPCLSRLWEAYAKLAAEPDHNTVSQQLYQPLITWAAHCITVFPISQNFALEDAA